MLFFVVALNSACFLCSAFNIFGSTLTYPLGSASDMTNLATYFDLEHLGFMALMGFGGAAAITIIGILTRTGTYAVYAVLIFGIGAFIPIISYFVLAIPNTIGAILTALDINSEISSPLLVTFGLWAAVWAALFAFGLVFQRDIHT